MLNTVNKQRNNSDKKSSFSTIDKVLTAGATILAGTAMAYGLAVLKPNPQVLPESYGYSLAHGEIRVYDCADAGSRPEYYPRPERTFSSMRVEKANISQLVANGNELIVKTNILEGSPRVEFKDTKEFTCMTESYIPANGRPRADWSIGTYVWD